MSNGSKVYVIDAKKASGLRTNREKTLKPAPETPGNGDGRSRTESAVSTSAARAASPQFVVFSYLLGPIAIFATQAGRRSKVWAPLAGVSAALIISSALGWDRILSAFGGKDSTVPILMLVTSIAILVGLTAWARAVYLIGRYRPLLARNLPEPMRRPSIVGMLGFLVPGLGLIVTGHHRRAACALWLSGLLALSLFVLTRVSLLWSWNRGAGSDVIHAAALERLFIVMGLAGVIAALAWVVQALDGGRLAEGRFAQDRRVSGGGAAFGLLSALVLFAVLFQPALVADTLDDFAVAVGYEGFRIIPLQAELAAMRLDPSRPAFAVKAAELYEGLGRHEEARILRVELAERWRPYVGMLRRHGLLDSRADAGTAEDKAVERPEQIEPPDPRVEEPVTSDATDDPWERIQTEYGLFALPRK